MEVVRRERTSKPSNLDDETACPRGRNKADGVDFFCCCWRRRIYKRVSRTRIQVTGCLVLDQSKSRSRIEVGPAESRRVSQSISFLSPTSVKTGRSELSKFEAREMMEMRETQNQARYGQRMIGSSDFRLRCSRFGRVESSSDGEEVVRLSCILTGESGEK